MAQLVVILVCMYLSSPRSLCLIAGVAHNYHSDIAFVEFEFLILAKTVIFESMLYYEVSS